MHARVLAGPALDLSAAPVAPAGTLGARLERVADALLAASGSIVARLTLLLIVLYGPMFWEMRVPAVMCAAVGLAWPRCVRSSAFWAVFAAIVGLGIVPRAYVVDNHKMLLVYWALALCCAGARADLLARNARVLIGLCFALATFWKATTASFTSGDFLAWELLSDGRFRNFAHLAVGLSTAELQGNAAALRDMEAGGMNVALSVSDRLRFVAVGMTVWTLFIEGLIGVSFLLGERVRWLGKARNWALIVFVATTYPIATVIGFGWLLALMGLAQCRSDERAAACAYFVLFVLMQLYLVPWGQLLTQAALTL